MQMIKKTKKMTAKPSRVSLEMSNSSETETVREGATTAEVRLIQAVMQQFSTTIAEIVRVQREQNSITSLNRAGEISYTPQLPAFRGLKDSKRITSEWFILVEEYAREL